VETILYLYDVAGVKDKYDLMRFDHSGAVATGMFDETWRRFVVKMATGSGKTKVMSLVLAWSYFHKLYEPDSELAATRTLIVAFEKAINALTVEDKGGAEISDTIKLRQTRPFVTKDQGYLVPKKSIFNKIIGDSHFELLFARFLEDCADVVAYAKNYLAVHFKLDYVNADGDISNYYPDFLVKLSAREIFIVETKGREDLDVPLKMQRLRQWCEDINRAQSDVKYDFLYVDEEGFQKYKPGSFRALVKSFVEYKGAE
jgi:type III restriction enzyme